MSAVATSTPGAPSTPQIPTTPGGPPTPPATSKPASTTPGTTDTVSVSPEEDDNPGNPTSHNVVSTITSHGDLGVPAAQTPGNGPYQATGDRMLPEAGVMKTPQAVGGTQMENWVKSNLGPAWSNAVDGGGIYVDRISPEMMDHLSAQQVQELNGQLRGQQIPVELQVKNADGESSVNGKPITVPSTQDAAQALAYNLRLEASQPGAEQHPGEALARLFAVNPSAALHWTGLDANSAPDINTTDEIANNMPQALKDMNADNVGSNWSGLSGDQIRGISTFTHQYLDEHQQSISTPSGAQDFVNKMLPAAATMDDTERGQFTGALFGGLTQYAGEHHDDGASLTNFVSNVLGYIPYGKAVSAAARFATSWMLSRYQGNSNPLSPDDVKSLFGDFMLQKGISDHFDRAARDAVDAAATAS